MGKDNTRAEGVCSHFVVQYFSFNFGDLNKRHEKNVHYMHRVFIHECKRPINHFVPSGLSVMHQASREQ